MTYRALDLMLDQFPPKVSGRGPFWRPRPAKPYKEIREPAWSWRAPLRPLSPSTWGYGTTTMLLDSDHVLTLDANAAYLGAASSVELAHGALQKTGRIPFSRKIPGYWLVTAHEWLVPWIWSPLGTATVPDRVWLTTPTVTLLDQLADDGYWPGVEIHDSWTSRSVCRLRRWTDQVASDRRTALRRRADFPGLYEDVKTGYSMAVTMMGTGKNSLCYRPDWSQSIRAQHAATTWRKVWRAIARGCPVLASGTVDEVSVPLAAYRELHEERETTPNPLALDETGERLGTFKIKATTLARDWMNP